MGTPCTVNVRANSGRNPRPDRVITAENLRDAIDTATALVDAADAEDDSFAGTGIVITGSVVTAGAARTLFGRDPE